MVGPPQAEVVAVLTRAPSAGGKTRLFHGLGIAPDPSLLAALLLDTLDGVSANFSRVVIVEPAASCADVRAIVPSDVAVLPQKGRSLGARMRAAFERLLRHGPRRIVLIGSDLPTITADAIGDAFDALRRDPRALVLGPADDGGYYLIGASGVPSVFEGIEWGNARVFDQTCLAAARADLNVYRVRPLSDVDTAADLERLVLDAPAGAARRTVAWARAHAWSSSRSPWA